MNQTNLPTQGELQRTFIAMLFAFAVSVVAQQIAELLIVVTSNWTISLPSGLTQFDAKTVWGLLSVATHCFLALLMLCISWVMWSRSRAAGHLGELTDVFSVKFVTFLVEVLLVTLYFSLSKSAEGDFTAYSQQKTVTSFLTPSSVRPEALQMFCIFCIFAVWDLIVDVAISPRNPLPTGFWSRCAAFVTGILTYCLISLLCAAGAFTLHQVAPTNQNAFQTVFGDIGLIALLLFFNQGKALEYYVRKLFPSEASRQNTARTPTVRSNVVTGLLVVMYLLCLAASSLNVCSPK